jgi:perosamine synthetase
MNYLLPHLLGAVARAQIENFDQILQKKIAVGMRYRELFSQIREVRLQEIIPGYNPCFWLNMVIVDKLTTRQIRCLGEELIQSGIEVRPGFWPLGDLAPFRKMRCGPQDTGEEIFHKGIVLPSSVYLAEDNCRKVDEIVNIFLAKLKRYLKK